MPVLRADVVARYGDEAPVAYGPDGVRPAPDLPAASPVVLFTDGRELVETQLDSWKVYWWAIEV
jgi:hypothetical protein